MHHPLHPAQEADHMHMRHLYYTCLLLTTLCPMLWGQQAAAMPLDPSRFASLGAFPTTPGTYQIDTKTLQFLDPSGTQLFTGVINEDNFAVVTFGGDTASGINIIATGNKPLALLFQGSFIYSGTLDGSGNDAIPGPGAGGSGVGGNTANRSSVWGRWGRRGRVLILRSAGGFVSGGGFIDVRGGSGGHASLRSGQPGQLGVVTFGQLPPAPFPFQGFFAPVK